VIQYGIAYEDDLEAERILEEEAMATKEEQIAQHEKNIRVLQDEVNRLKGGPSAQVDIAARHAAENESASLFDKLTSEELTELYLTDKKRWKEVIDAKESAGERKLRQLNNRPIG
jgi:hypothetical protein